MAFRTTAATRFETFDLHRTSYKRIGDHEIEVNILVPKEISPGKHPLIVKWHGGGLTTGTAAYPDWFASWLVPFLHRNHAIAVLPNYRLAPEHTGDDILEDLDDFWAWFRSSLPAYVASKKPSVELDISRVLVHGDSAGGWCALQSVLGQPQSTFRACLVQYPVVNDFPMAPDDKPCGETIPPKEVLDEFVAGIVPGTILSSVTPPARDLVSVMMRAHGRWEELFGKGKHLMPTTRVENAEFLVPLYIVHGKDDTNVPVKWTHEFVNNVRKVLPETKIELVTPPGDHGFDGALYEEDHPWLAGLLKRVEEDWLS
ncbi:alpha/beta-hydrolase [Lophiostoma macrostomum CBS 122681]|uniref:Alpha/beta-hydrolase n=1 Tax=Lophiostoma macrostomum CBS 122681 TaxID=1314788 RepID=A0A6A6SPW9_9PLEO|nr:alpha/beta-hydrolase [Lophiostoma macrostomum CBS 122681]